MDQIKIGKYIKDLRVNKKLTQKELADILHISHQAVSKWENGETLPDTSILLELAELLNTTVDNILHGGIYLVNDRKLISITDILEGIECFRKIKTILKKESLFYQGMIEGISNKMNFDFEDALNNHTEILVAEIILQGIKQSNMYVLKEEVEKYFTNQKLITIINKELERI